MARKFNSNTKKIAAWNANALKNKINEVETFLHKHKIDIFIITETKLQENTDTIKIAQYITHRYDRTNQNPGGAVAILVKNNIPYIRTKINQALTFECAAIKLNNNWALQQTHKLF